jgi:hypothetical protein
MKPNRTLVVRLLCVYALLLIPAVARAQFAATPFADPATGERYHVESALQFWNPEPNLKVSSESLGIIGSEIDAKSDLGIQQKRLMELRFVLRPARKHKFRIAYLPMNYTATNSVHRDFTFNGIRYGVNLPVKTEFKWDTWMLGYEYDFVYRDRFFAGMVLQAKLTNVQVNLQAPIGSDFVIAKAPIPNIGGIVRFYAAPNISITGELDGAKVPESINEDYKAHYWDFDLYGTVNFNDYAGVQVGWRSIDVAYLVKKDQGTFEMKGLYFGGVVRY